MIPQIPPVTMMHNRKCTICQMQLSDIKTEAPIKSYNEEHFYSVKDPINSVVSGSRFSVIMFLMLRTNSLFSVNLCMYSNSVLECIAHDLIR